MLKIKALLIIMAIPTAFACSQNTENEIAIIRENFKVIEKAIGENKLSKTIVDFDWPDENAYGTITAYTENKEIRKIVFDKLINEENSQVINFYVLNNTLFFAYHISKAPRWVDAENMELHHSEYRYYFKSEEPIKCLEKAIVIDSNTKESAEIISSKTPNTEVSCASAGSILDEYREVLKLIENQL